MSDFVCRKKPGGLALVPVKLLLGVSLLLSSHLLPAQAVPPDLSGQWRKITHEDVLDRGLGPDLGEYWALPLNDAARMRADSYNGEWVNQSLELQCRPHPTGYQQLGADAMRIEKELDPASRELIGYNVLYRRTPGSRMIFMDGRPHPGPYAAHSWEGFSTARWEGDTLTVTSTHLKESFIRRNGVQGSFRRTVTEHVSLDEPYLQWILIVNDDDYLTEPLIRSVTWIRDTRGEMQVYPCTPAPDEIRPDLARDHVPHYLPWRNSWLAEIAAKYKTPLEGMRGGADTMYPEAQSRLKGITPPDIHFAFKPEYKDESTHVAERAAAQPVGIREYKPQILHVQGSVYMLAGAGGNVTMLAGRDGILLVDSGAPEATDKVLASIQQFGEQHPVTLLPDAWTASAQPFANAWQIANSPAPIKIRMIVNTSMSADFTGGNEKIANSKLFKPIGIEGGAEQANGEVIVAFQKVLDRMQVAKLPERALPTTTYFADRFRLHRYLNGDGIELVHMPAAHTDGDSIVWFRNSNVISTGGIFNAETYPVIDVENGGTIQGLLNALIKITDLGDLDYMAQNGTMVIPGHGRLCDISEVAYYRDMMIVIRDRIRDLKEKGMTIEQVKAAKPTLDYDPLFGREAGLTAKLIESVYRTVDPSSSH